MFRQAFRSLTVWFFANRDFQPLRDAISRWAMPYWPSYRPAMLAWNVMYDRQDPKPVSEAQNAGRWLWRRTDGPFDINPGSGDAFSRGRRPQQEANVLAAVPGPVDLFCHTLPRRIAREPALVLYSGADTSIAGFMTELLPRYFALDEMGVPNDVLLLVTLDMAKQIYFQDAVIDQVFTGRPLEPLRKHRLVRLDCLHEIQVPHNSIPLMTRMAERMTRCYGPFTADGPPVLLCAGGLERADAISENFRDLVPEVFGRNPIVIDPARSSLRKLVKALANAPCVAAPNTGEAAAIALAPSRTRPLFELDVAITPHAQVDSFIKDIGEDRRKIRRAKPGTR